MCLQVDLHHVQIQLCGRSFLQCLTYFLVFLNHFLDFLFYYTETLMMMMMLLLMMTMKHKISWNFIKKKAKKNFGFLFVLFCFIVLLGWPFIVFYFLFFGNTRGIICNNFKWQIQHQTKHRTQHNILEKLFQVFFFLAFYLQ